MDASLLQPGQVVLGKYRIDRVLGQGGMGLVLAATHLALRQEVAIKIMLPGQKLTQEHHDRFLREARASARLKSRHVAKVLDVGQTESGAPYMIMELLAGKDLEKMLKERRKLPVSEAIGYLLQACEAVAEAHAASVVHRDLKPANLFVAADVDGSACVKVLDFGISKLSDATQGLTQEKQALGTPYYMSPEQLVSSRSVDARGDVWALGIIVYELVTGAPPFLGESVPELVTHVLYTQPRPLSDIDPSLAPLWAVLARALEKDREKRYRNVVELAAALAPFGPPDAQVYVGRIATVLGEASSPSPSMLGASGERISQPLPLAAVTGTAPAQQVVVPAITPPLPAAPITGGLPPVAPVTGGLVGSPMAPVTGGVVSSPRLPVAPVAPAALVTGGVVGVAPGATMPVAQGPLLAQQPAAAQSTLGAAVAQPVPKTTISRRVVYPLIALGMVVPIAVGVIVLLGGRVASTKDVDAGAVVVAETSGTPGKSAPEPPSSSASAVSVSVGPTASASVSAGAPLAKPAQPGTINKVKPPPVSATATSNNPYGRR